MTDIKDNSAGKDYFKNNVKKVKNPASEFISE